MIICNHVSSCFIYLSVFTSTSASVNFLSVFCRVHLTTALEEAGRQGLKTPVVDEASTKHFWMSF